MIFSNLRGYQRLGFVAEDRDEKVIDLGGADGDVLYISIHTNEVPTVFPLPREGGVETGGLHYMPNFKPSPPGVNAPAYPAPAV